MPIIRVEIDERRVADAETAARLIESLTDAVGAVLGAEVAKYAEVMIVPRDPRLWAFGGRQLSNAKIQTQAER